MKINLLPVIALWLLLPASASRSQDAASPDSSLEQEMTDLHLLEKSGLRITSATYGSGTSFADVTDETTRLLNQQTKFYARPEWLLVDPTPGWNKALVIVFTFEGRRYIFSCGEGGEVRIPLLKRAASEQAAASSSGEHKN